MHETGLIRAAVAALEEATRPRAVKVVRLALGEGVDVGSAELAWRTAVAGTMLESAELQWQRAADWLLCFGCGTEYEGQRLDPCPECGENALVLQPAEEVVVTGWSCAD